MLLISQLYTVKELLLLAIFILFVVNKFRTYRRLQTFKGPFSSGWSNFWHSRVILNTQSYLVYEQVNKKYGPIARVGPNELVTCSPELLMHMSAVRSPYVRSRWFNSATRLEPGRDHVFSQLDEEKHTKRRQQMAAGYSGKENLALESDIDKRVQEFLQLIRTKYLSSSSKLIPMDLARKAQFFTLDVISTIGFGEPFGDLTSDSDVHGYIKAAGEFLSLSPWFAALGLTPVLQYPPIARLFGPSEKDALGVGRIMAAARGIIETRLTKPTEGRSDMLASFMRHGLTKDDLFTESLLQILAGSDTTAAGIRSVMLYLFTHPRVYNKLRVEIENAVSQGTAPAAPDIVQETCLRELSYLQAVVREGIRMYPPVTDVVPKMVPQGGDTVIIDGKQVYLPGGTDISYNVWGLQHDTGIFGDDAHLYRPERWLPENAKDQNQLAVMKRTTDMIFGYGKYQCLGKPIAWMEMTKLTFEFLRNFDWAIANPEDPWRSKNYMGLFLQDEMWVIVTERD
ncbi:benzoate 4-monooxygenase cytochrome-like protein P450 [Pyrenochaeta sp. DS3sAY3a]|nr:benzoate 4-monooxygenase cytochrome-like protein P450 [Pyrenochaeta sp. DS3sAY3a]